MGDDVGLTVVGLVVGISVGTVVLGGEVSLSWSKDPDGADVGALASGLMQYLTPSVPLPVHPGTGWCILGRL